jgi:hypothetical protein
MCNAHLINSYSKTFFFNFPVNTNMIKLMMSLKHLELLL